MAGVMRISTTAIESYRLFMQPNQDWMSEKELVNSILGKFIPTPAVLLGSAYGKVLEDPDRYQVPGGYQCEGYSFGLESIVPALDLIDRRGMFEVKATKRYGADCEVVAKVDHLYGLHLSEFKTTTKGFDADKYIASCQWRFYADIFEPRRITYHVFLLDDHDNGVAELKSIETLRLYPYPAVHADCADLVRDFAHFVRVKGIDNVLRERQQKAEAA